MDLLIVGDDEVTNHAIRTLLRRLGLEVETAGTMLSAIDELARLPRAVVVNWIQFGNDGIEVLKTIRDTGLDASVAVVTCRTKNQEIQQIESPRPNAIFERPLNFEDFGDWLCTLFSEV